MEDRQKGNNQMSQSLVDNLINRLLAETFPWEQIEFQLYEIEQLLIASRDILVKEPRLLELKAPINIAGNLHGEFNALLSVFKHDGLPPQSKYLFLGNYADRFRYRLDTTLLLLAFKIKYPKNIFLLRGNYDGVSWLSPQHIFADECEEVKMHQLELFNTVNDCLDCLPVAALINDKVLCTHGGLSSPSLHDLHYIKNTWRPIHIPRKDYTTRPIYMPKLELLCDLDGSDPSMEKKVNRYGNTLGATEVQEFLKKRGLRLICCDNQVGRRGYKVLGEQRLVFISSGSSSIGSAYQYHYKNCGKSCAMMSVDGNLSYSFHILKPEQFVGDYKFMAAATQPESSSGVSLTCGTTMNNYAEDPPLKKHAERTSMFRFGSSTNTTKYRSSSPELKLSEANSGIASERAKQESVPLIQQACIGVSLLGSSGFLVLGSELEMFDGHSKMLDTYISF